MTKDINITGCTGQPNLTQNEYNIAVNKHWNVIPNPYNNNPDRPHKSDGNYIVDIVLSGGVSALVVNLSWTSDAVNQTGYHIYRSTDGTNYSLLATQSGTTYSDTTPGAATYYYKVSAYNTYGESNPSNIINETTTANALSAPSSLMLLYDDGTGGYNLKWQDNSSNETGFKLYISTDSVNYSLLATIGANITYYAGTLSNSGTYYFKVTAYNINGESSPSNIVTLHSSSIGSFPTVTASGSTSGGYFTGVLTPNFGTMATGNAEPSYYESSAPNEWGQYGRGRFIQHGGSIPTYYQYVFITGQVVPGYYSDVGAGTKI